MTVSDTNPYWVAEQILWNALEDTDKAHGAALAEWRGQQWSDGHTGKDFRTGQIPDAPAKNEVPALGFRTLGVLLPEEGAKYGPHDRHYGIAIRGVLYAESQREATGDKLIKTFQYLTEKAIGAAVPDIRATNSIYLPAGELVNPIGDIWCASNLDFWDFIKEGEFPWFEFPLVVLLNLEAIWPHTH